MKKRESRDASVPFPNEQLAQTARQVLAVDKPLRPSEQYHAFSVDQSTLKMYDSPICACLCRSELKPASSQVKAKTVALARVALDHILSDAQLIVETMHSFAPSNEAGGTKESMLSKESTLEVGLRGAWQAQQPSSNAA